MLTEVAEPIPQGFEANVEIHPAMIEIKLSILINNSISSYHFNHNHFYNILLLLIVICTWLLKEASHGRFIIIVFCG
jgi:hypothetical protein